MYIKAAYLLGCAAFFFVAGCQSVTQRIHKADAYALSHGFSSLEIPAYPFTLKGYYKLSPAASHAYVFIEGDGFLYMQPGIESTNPTPLQPIALQLAIAHDRNAVYMARPCQYIYSPPCTSTLWCTGRYSDKMVLALNKGLDFLKKRFSFTSFTLVGYSGGGFMALRLAKDREDVKAVYTVAANIAFAYWMGLHDFSAFPYSIKDPASKCLSIPEYHYHGGDDTIVPALVGEAYKKRCPQAHTYMVPKMKHNSNWAQLWSSFCEKAARASSIEDTHKASGS